MRDAKAVGRTTWRNWSGAVEAHPRAFLRPADLDALKTALRDATAQGATVRVVGSGHSFPPLCATDETMLSVDALRGVEAVDADAREATVWAGTPLRELGRQLAERGLGMENLGDIDKQSLGGALGTGTHGTGARFGVLATQARALTLVTARGEVVECSEETEPSLFRAAQVSLGALGVMARVRLRLLPAYRLSLARRTMSLEECLAGLDTARTTHRHFEFFWFPHTDRVMTKAMDLTEDSPRGMGVGRWFNELVLENAIFGAVSRACRLKPSLCAPVSRLSARLASEGGMAGASHAMFATPRWVRFQEMEYAVPVERGPDCLRELQAFIAREQLGVHFPVEYRFVRGDDIFLSPAHGGDRAFIAVHQYQGMPLEPYFSRAEAIFRNHGGRPHWGKLHTQTAATLKDLYPRWADFQRERARLDPEGRFLNPYLRRLFLESP
ncbi:FAD-binding oxidoreductase [Corallococcus sp. H22C18031201]|uniref:D-arabinono-1,4-lactone oxidase n=1 Tax=Citreicoccus inhibens TaxID=2849499 RepID=UPI000E71A037|nr:D-arabinono-1,4-lactone oxidase [Citreicoccus inhibens]MBU8898020.1 FAD-binding protein [Citreicoccus inhibens]RJS15782.1 FAD-binding oxidoreductase [Corallococcus sp. H22C18031201]